jgi:hypothetical protein
VQPLRIVLQYEPVELGVPVVDENGVRDLLENGPSKS